MKLALLIASMGLYVAPATPLYEATESISEPETSIVEETTSEETTSEETPAEDTDPGYTDPGDVPFTYNDFYKAMQTWLQMYLPATAVTAIMLAITLAVVAFRVIAFAKKLKKSKDANADEIAEKVLAIIKDNFKDMADDTIKDLSEKVTEIKPVLDTFAKILALSQEDSPEARVAILNLISALGVSDEATKQAEDSKKELETKAEEEKKSKEETVKELTEIASYDGTQL